ncbi:hypothetical protein IJJ37_01270 [Candidatus Saccharibacteria bacterium]|nr:hypothetical protein [Candidatus Saccharibacteria bacterium]
MKKNISRIPYVLATFMLGVFLMFGGIGNVYAEGEEENSGDETTTEMEEAATSISISPVSKVLELKPDTVYDDFFKITNNSKNPLKFEAYASPYSYTYSDTDDEYQLGFNHENTYTQITRWITFRDAEGNYVKNPKFVAEGGETVEVHYRVSTPSSIPAGGQYAVLFAHTLSDTTEVSGIKTEASPGLVLYGRSNGETITTSEISDVELSQTLKVGDTSKSIINGSAKIKNTGNVDFMAYGTLRVTGIFGRTYYETPANQGKLSVIPESELVLSDSWDDTPYFGLFNATWTVTVSEEEPQIVTRTILILPTPIIILMILLLTIIIIWIIILIRKRKERRSRFMV